jgi:hypothetical protein
MPQPKLKRLIYPTQLIDREATRLQVQLRRIYRSYQRHHINKVLCLGDGEGAIKVAFQKMQVDVKDFCSKHGLIFDGDFTELEEGLNESLTSWRKIVDHF